MSFLRRIFGLPDPVENAAPEPPPAAAISEKSDTIPTSPFATQEIGSVGTSFPDSATPRDATQRISLVKDTITDAHLRFAQRTDVGINRDNNEDAVFGFYANHQSNDQAPEFGVFVLSDGMGGHQSGEVASAMAVRGIANRVLQNVYIPLLRDKDQAHYPPISEVVTEAFEKANEDIHKSIPEGGGATCTAIVILGNQATIAHVGDSRCYQINGDDISLMTRDHSFAQRLVEIGQITQDEVRTHPKRSELYRALGIRPNVEVDVATHKIPDEAYYLLCSDGLWEPIDDLALKDIVVNNETPRAIAYELIEAAKALGSDDNITAQVVQVG